MWGSISLLGRRRQVKDPDNRRFVRAVGCRKKKKKGNLQKTFEKMYLRSKKTFVKMYLCRKTGYEKT